MNEPRKAIYTRRGEEQKACWVHGFFQAVHEDGEMPAAVVEFQDGKVDYVSVDYITFTDSPEWRKP